jgi:hypothetical protein
MVIEELEKLGYRAKIIKRESMSFREEQMRC